MSLENNEPKPVVDTTVPSFRQIVTGQGITDKMTAEEAKKYFEWACSGSIVLGVRYSPRDGWQPEFDNKGGH